MITFEDPTRTNLQLNGRPIWSMRFDTTEPITVRDVQEYIRDYEEDGENPFDEFKFKINLNFSQQGWRTRSQWITTDDLQNDTSLWRGYEDDIDDVQLRTLGSFELLLIRKPNPNGGKDEHNDCLHTALTKAFPFSVGRTVSTQDRKGKWKKSIKQIQKADLKKLLHLERDDPIHYKRLPEIEDEIQIRIHLMGDYTHTSGKPYDREATLRLENGHYSYVPPVSQRNMQFNPTKEPATLITSFGSGNGKYVLFDGENEYESEVIPSVSIKQYVMTVRTKEELRTKHKERMDNINALAKETGGFMDLAKYGFRASYFVRHYFVKFSKLYPADPIEEQEARWISKAMGGGLNWANNDTTLKRGFQYDINSFYPSMMKSSMTFPTKKGTFIKAETKKQGHTYSYGIYRVKVEDLNEKFVQKRKNEYWTHYDLNRAIQTGAKVSLIEDGEANTLMYDPTTRVKAVGLFRTMIERLYTLKKKGCKTAKEILNCIWGTLCQKNTITKTHGNDDEEILNFRELKNAYLKLKGRFVSGIMKEEMYTYKTAYARLGVFLTAFGRVKLSKVVEPFLTNIHYVNTDGFVSDKEIPFKCSDRLGEWKVENYGKCYIKHCKKKMFQET